MSSSQSSVFEPLGATVGQLLRHGFALTVDQKSRANAAQMSQDLLNAAFSPTVDLPAAEAKCASLVEQKLLCCYPFMSKDKGIDWIVNSLPREIHALFSATAFTGNMQAFVARLIEDLHCSLEVVINAVVYVAKAVKNGVPFTGRSAQKMILAACVVAAKVRDDKYYSMSYYSRIGGVTKQEMLEAELAMLHALNFETFVNEADYGVMLFTLRSCHSQLDAQAGFGRWETIVRQLGIPSSTYRQPFEGSVKLFSDRRRGGPSLTDAHTEARAQPQQPSTLTRRSSSMTRGSTVVGSSGPSSPTHGRLSRQNSLSSNSASSPTNVASLRRTGSLSSSPNGLVDRLRGTTKTLRHESCSPLAASRRLSMGGLSSSTRRESSSDLTNSTSNSSNGTSGSQPIRIKKNSPPPLSQGSPTWSRTRARNNSGNSVDGMSASLNSNTGI